jgi:hypothetical protein
MMAKYLIAVCAMIFMQEAAWCQQQKDTIPRQDSVPVFIKGRASVPFVKPEKTDSPYKVDSFTRKKHDPRKATLYSTFLPGLGQVYNKKYWKVPIVAAALGIPAYLYFSNRREVKNAQFAINIIVNRAGDTSAVSQAVLNTVEPQFREAVAGGYDNVLRSYRNQVRQYEDYSVLFFMLFWGLQIVDATVDAHLKDFDVSDKLSMRIAPSSESMHMVGGGVSLVFDMHKARHRPISLP